MAAFVTIERHRSIKKHGVNTDYKTCYTYKAKNKARDVENEIVT